MRKMQIKQEKATKLLRVKNFKKIKLIIWINLNKLEKGEILNQNNQNIINLNRLLLLHKSIYKQFNKLLLRILMLNQYNKI